MNNSFYKGHEEGGGESENEIHHLLGDGLPILSRETRLIACDFDEREQERVGYFVSRT